MSSRKKPINGEAQIDVVQTVRQGPGNKEEFQLKKEEVPMTEGNDGNIQPDSNEATDAQKELPDNPAVVGVTKKMTLNIGNYESVAVSVHLSMPCVPEKDSVNTMYEKVNKWVDARIVTERDSVRASQAGQAG